MGGGGGRGDNQSAITMEDDNTCKPIRIEYSCRKELLSDKCLKIYP